MVVEAMTTKDIPQVLEIYAEGIQTGDATFTTEVPPAEAWDAAHLQCCRFVAREGAWIAGFVALSPIYSAPAYRGHVELSIYVRARNYRSGIGGALMAAVIAGSEESGIWTLESSIIAGNTASIALHRKYGFREIGRRSCVARDRNGKWRDTVLMERRSEIIV